MAQKMRNRARVYLGLVKLKFVCVCVSGGQHLMGFRASLVARCVVLYVIVIDYGK